MYKLSESPDVIIRIEDGACIPMVGSNRHYQEYLEWAAAGNQPEPYVAPVVIPSTVTMRQARLALLQSGLLATVNAALDAMVGPEGEAARIEWEYATMVERDSPLVTGLASALGMNDEQMDGLFTLAASL